MPANKFKTPMVADIKALTGLKPTDKDKKNSKSNRGANKMNKKTPMANP